MMDEKIQVGSVVQINETHGRNGWIGAFVLVNELKPWGIQGFVHHINSHDQHGDVWIRLQWSEIDYVGDAPLVPKDFMEEKHNEP